MKAKSKKPEAVLSVYFAWYTELGARPVRVTTRSPDILGFHPILVPCDGATPRRLLVRRESLYADEDLALRAQIAYMTSMLRVHRKHLQDTREALELARARRARIRKPSTARKPKT